MLELPAIHSDRIKPFTVFGFDVFNAGTLYSKFGAIVGIPINFSYSSTEDIEKSDIMVWCEGDFFVFIFIKNLYFRSTIILLIGPRPKHNSC